MDKVLTEPLKCTDARIYYENQIPYMEWKGKGITADGTKLIVNIPKLSLDLIGVELIGNRDFMGFNVFDMEHILLKGKPNNNEWFSVHIEEREVSKEQLEKELGYKIKLV